MLLKTCPVICQRQPIRRMWAHGKSRLKGEEAGLKQPKALELDKIELQSLRIKLWSWKCTYQVAVM